MALAEDHVAEMGGDTITLEVRQSNQPALTLYDALRYRRVGFRRHYYADGEDAIIMTKEIRNFDEAGLP